MKDALPLVATAVIGLIVYYTQEWIKRRSALAERRQALYEVILRNVFDLLVARTGDTRSKFLTEIEKSWLFASDGVLRACYVYLDLYDRTERAGQDILEVARNDESKRLELEDAFAAIFLAMRRDIRWTRISHKWANANVELYPWGIISPAGAEARQTLSALDTVTVAKSLQI